MWNTAAWRVRQRFEEALQGNSERGRILGQVNVPGSADTLNQSLKKPRWLISSSSANSYASTR